MSHDQITIEDADTKHSEAYPNEICRQIYAMNAAHQWLEVMKSAAVERGKASELVKTRAGRRRKVTVCFPNC